MLGRGHRDAAREGLGVVLLDGGADGGGLLHPLPLAPRGTAWGVDFLSLCFPACLWSACRIFCASAKCVGRRRASRSRASRRRTGRVVASSAAFSSCWTAHGGRWAPLCRHLIRIAVWVSSCRVWAEAVWHEWPRRSLHKNRHGPCASVSLYYNISYICTCWRLFNSPHLPTPPFNPTAQPQNASFLTSLTRGKNKKC